MLDTAGSTFTLNSHKPQLEANVAVHWSRFFQYIFLKPKHTATCKLHTESEDRTAAHTHTCTSGSVDFGLSVRPAKLILIYFGKTKHVERA